MDAVAVFQGNSHNRAKIIQGFIADAPLPETIILDHHRLFGLPDFAAHAHALFDPPAQLALKKAHPNLHLNLIFAGLVQVDVAVFGSGQPGGPLQYRLKQLLFIQVVDQPDGSFVQRREILILPAQGFFSLVNSADFPFKLPRPHQQLLSGHFVRF